MWELPTLPWERSYRAREAGQANKLRVAEGCRREVWVGRRQNEAAAVSSCVLRATGHGNSKKD